MSELVCKVARIEKRKVGVQLIAEAVARVRLGDPVDVGEYLAVEYTTLPDLSSQADSLSAEAIGIHKAALDLTKRLTDIINPDKSEQVFNQFIGQFKNPVTQMYRLAAYAQHLTFNQAQEILEIDDTDKLMETIMASLKHEYSVTEIQREIQSQAREGLEQQQREHMLRQQKRAIEQALGEDENDDEIAELKEELRQANLPEAAQKEVDREVKRLSRMSPTPQIFRLHVAILNLLPNCRGTSSRKTISISNTLRTF